MGNVRPPGSSWARAMLASVLTVLALVGTTGPALASPGTGTQAASSQQAAAPKGVKHGAGIMTKNGTWFGQWINKGRIGYCIDPNLNVATMPWTAAPTVKGLTAAQTARLAYIVTTYGDTRDKNRAAAVRLALLLIMDSKSSAVRASFALRRLSSPKPLFRSLQLAPLIPVNQTPPELLSKTVPAGAMARGRGLPRRDGGR